MRTKPYKPLTAMILCMVLALTLVCTTFAADPDVTIRITPPHSMANRQAAVEILITDRTRKGLKSAKTKTESGGWQDLTLEQLGNQYYSVLDVTENGGVQVHVTGWDGTVYEKSRDIRLDALEDWSGGVPSPTVQTLVSVQPVKAEAPVESTTESAVNNSGKTSTALTPSGQGTVVDNVTSENGKEFYTISTPAENTFYLVVDKERESENVYFLNAVTESDLMALAEKDEAAHFESAVPEPAPVCSCQEKCVPGEVNTACPVCVLSLKDCTGKAPVTMEPTQPEAKRDSSSLLLVLIVALAAGGAGWYFKIYKPKKALDSAEDFEDLTEEETVNEDDMEETYHNDFQDEPEEPEDYGE